MFHPTILIRTALALLLFSSGELARAGEDDAADEFRDTEVQTLFAFDDVSIPYTQNLRLEMRQPTRHPANPVLRRGPAGAPDSLAVQFYGSVIRQGDRYRMWYVAADEATDKTIPASAHWRAAYAESHDGVHWTKPNLGLVEYGGNKNNNLIHTTPSPLGFVNLKVLHDPDDDDPARRFKITTHVYFRGRRRLGTLAPFVSADGLHWRMERDVTPLRAELPLEGLVLPSVHFEPCGGLYKWEGIYYITGQNALNATRPYQGRIARTYRSHDFVHWSATSNLAFVRSTQHEYLGSGRSLEGEQNHEGISVWNRGNVLLGVYGRWHGAEKWSDIAVDLGFVLSNDGLKFREPAHEWTLLQRGKDGAWDQGGLLQGQGFENIGDKTFIYYGAWDPRPTGTSPAPPRGGVGIAELPRDRFGSLMVEEAGQGPGDYQLPHVTSEFITAAIPIEQSAKPSFYVNAEGLSEQATLKIELLAENETPLADFVGKNAAVVRTSGFHTPIRWRPSLSDSDLPSRIRMRVTFAGAERSKIRFSALYVGDVARDDRER